MHCHRPMRRGQRGVAALVVTLLLCLTMVLAVAFAQRDIAAEERRSANDYRSAQAFEAAEAGLEWALARVDDPTRLDADCRPSAVGRNSSSLNSRGSRSSALGVPVRANSK